MDSKIRNVIMGQNQGENLYVGSGKAIETRNGKMLKISFSADDLAKMQSYLNERGWMTVIVNKRQQPSQSGATHYCTIDNWQPPQDQGQYQQPQQQYQQRPPVQQQRQAPPPQQQYRQPDNGGFGGNRQAPPIPESGSGDFDDTDIPF
jgi:hypothetical protein